ncbi:hypothetical protein FRC04_004881 [Tulasnella sp. 424]|nr:hypothetical protein FRC04_004881 [Tulasnella sp. 424]KAG8963472.1 hypothetical protein FRC05_004723 [Tulasnella sp. 425]
MPIPEIEIMEEAPVQELPPRSFTRSSEQCQVEVAPETPTEEPPRAPSAQAQVEEAPVNIFVAEPLLTEIVNLKETFTEELPMSASPAPTAVEPPTPITPVVPKKRKPRPRKFIPRRPVIKLRRSRPKKDGTKRVQLLIAAPRVVGRFFDLVASVENAILGSRSAPKSSPGQDTRGKTSSPARKVGSAETVEHCPSGSSTQNTDIPASVVTALKLHLPSLYLRSKRGIPELYETSQTFWSQTPRTDIYHHHERRPSPNSNRRVSCAHLFLLGSYGASKLRLTLPFSTLREAVGTFRSRVRSPRRVRVQPGDSDVAFWIIGARYRCNGCTGQQRKGKAKANPSYVAWDERIMSQLPDAARKEFPTVEMRKQFIVAEDHRTLKQWADPRPAKSTELVALSLKWPALDSTTLDGSSASPRNVMPAPGSPVAAGIHATDAFPLPTPGSAKQKAERSCGKCLQAGCKGNRTMDLCANACIGCKRFSCAKARREGRNACLESAREVLQSPNPPKPRSTDLGNSPRRDRNMEVHNCGTEEEKEEKSVEEVFGLI